MLLTLISLSPMIFLFSLQIDSLIVLVISSALLVMMIVFIVVIEPAIENLAVLSRLIREHRVARHELRDGSPEELKELDNRQLKRATRELEVLGFKCIGQQLLDVIRSEEKSHTSSVDALLAPKTEPARFEQQSFVRVFAHRQHGCLGTIIFMVNRHVQSGLTVEIKYITNIISFAGLGENDWCYSTNNDGLDVLALAIAKLWRHPRGLWTRMPEATALQLLGTHLAKRASIAESAGVLWLRGFTMDDYLEWEQIAMRRIRTPFEHLTPRKMAWQLFWLKREGATPEWMGELKGKIEP